MNLIIQIVVLYSMFIFLSYPLWRNVGKPNRMCASVDVQSDIAANCHQIACAHTFHDHSRCQSFPSTSVLQRFEAEISLRSNEIFCHFSGGIFPRKCRIVSFRFILRQLQYPIVLSRHRICFEQLTAEQNLETNCGDIFLPVWPDNFAIWSGCKVKAGYDGL